MYNPKILIRIGRVSSIDYPSGAVRVCIEDQDDIVTDDLPMLYHEYEMPNVGEMVLCLFMGTGMESGVCLGRYYYDGETPVWSGPNIYYKKFLKDAFVKYDKSSKTFNLNSNEVVIDGNATINGNLIVNGNVTTTGNVTVGGMLAVASTMSVSGDATISGKSFLSHRHGGVTGGPSNTGTVV